jgi:hypothetical protein
LGQGKRGARNRKLKKVHLNFPSVYPIKQDMSRVLGQDEQNVLLKQIDKLTKTASQLKDGLPEQPFLRNWQSDMVVEKCSDVRDDLVGCNPRELLEATAGQLNCPPKEKALDPMVWDEDGRLCYAKKVLIDAWKQVKLDKHGKVIYEDVINDKGVRVRVPQKEHKTLDIDELSKKYATYLMNLISKNDKLQLALSNAMDTTGTVPPIILNYYRNNPYLLAFCENKSKRELRFAAGGGASLDLKFFRGIAQFTEDNNYADSRTRNEFVTLLTAFNSSLDSESGAKFMNIFMNPLSPGALNIRGQFDIHRPPNNATADLFTDSRAFLDFLNIPAFERHDTTGGRVIHAVHSNVMELIFTAIAALHRDSIRYPKLKKFVNSMGDLLQFGELAPETENPENKCRQAGVAAANAVAFLPQALKAWLANLPSTWRAPGPVGEKPKMIQRRVGTIAGEENNEAARERRVENVGGFSKAVARLYPGGEIFNPLAVGAPFPNSVDTQRRVISQKQLVVPAVDGALAESSRDRIAKALLLRGGSEDLEAGESETALEGGRSYANLYDAADAKRGVVNNPDREQRANPSTVVLSNQVIEDPRMIMQNFISLCYYLNWVEMYGHPGKDSSVLGLFKSLRVSYDNMMMARSNLEELLKKKADEAANATEISQITEKMIDDAINNKRGADASYVGVNIRIAKKIAELLDIGWEKCESSSELQKKSVDPANNGWMDKMLPHQALFYEAGAAAQYPKFTVNQLPGIADNRVYFTPAELITTYKVNGNVGYADFNHTTLRGAGGGLNANNTSWGVRDYDFVAVTSPLPDWVRKPALGFAPAGAPADRLETVVEGHPIRYTYQYDESNSSLTGFGIHTVEFRKAWKSMYTTYEGIKTRKNYMNKVGYEQFMSRIMDLHLTFAQSCEKGRDYFVKMFKYSKQTSFNRDGGLPEDPRSITKDMFVDNPNVLADYQASVKKTAELMRPLTDMNVCKVVIGDSQHFIFKNNSFYPNEAQKIAASNSARDVYDDFAELKENWYGTLISLANRENAVTAARGWTTAGNIFNAKNDAEAEIGSAIQLMQKAVTIIETDVSYDVFTRAPGAPGTNMPAKVKKYFGSCEPMDQNDYSMYGRRRKTLDFDRPEDELFFLGVEGWAKLYSRSRYGSEGAKIREVMTDLLTQAIGGNVRAVAYINTILKTAGGLDADKRLGILSFVDPYDANSDPRIRTNYVDGRETIRTVQNIDVDDRQNLTLGVEDLLFLYSKDDTARREGTGGNRTLSASERDAYSRYLIFMHKVSGGNPSRLASRVLSMAEADTKIVNPATQELLPQYGGPDNAKFPGTGAPAFPAGDNAGAFAIQAKYSPVAQAWQSLIPTIPRIVDATGRVEMLKEITPEDSKESLTLRTFIAMNIVGLTSHPSPFFASVGKLAGGEESQLEGGEASQIQEVEAVTPELEFDNLMNEILTGGRSRKLSPPQRQSPKSKRNNDDRTQEQYELDKALEREGYPPVNRVKVGEKGPRQLNKYGTENVGTFQAVSEPVLECERLMGVSYYTKTPRGIKYWYNDKAKCFKPVDASSKARETYSKLESFQRLANWMNGATRKEREMELQKARDVIAADSAYDKLTHAEREELAESMLPGYLLEIPSTSALKTASFIEEDVREQLNEITDTSNAEERSKLMHLIRTNKLMEEEWKDEDGLVELERLKDLVEEMVKSAQLCTVVSEGVKDISTKADVKKNMQIVQSGDYSTPANQQFKESLSPKVKMLLDSENNFASKCVIQEIGVNDAVLLPPSIANRIDTVELGKTGNAGDKALSPIVQWWRMAYHHTAKKEKEVALRVAEKIDPSRVGNAQELTEKSLEKDTLEDKINRAVDENARKYLPSLHSYAESE